MTITEITENTFPQDPVRYCVDSILKEARQEDRLVRQILYTMLSAYTNDPINLAINSPSGEGKSYVLTKVAKMFPEEDMVFLSHMTEKALFHKSGDYVIINEAGQYVSIDQKKDEIESEIQGASVIYAAAVDSSHHDRWPEIQRRGKNEFGY